MHVAPVKLAVAEEESEGDELVVDVRLGEVDGDCVEDADTLGEALLEPVVLAVGDGVAEPDTLELAVAEEESDSDALAVNVGLGEVKSAGAASDATSVAPNARA